MGAWQGQKLFPRRLQRLLRTTFEPQIAQQIQHHARAVLSRRRERQATKSSQLKFKLGNITRIQAVVTAVVGSGCDFVDHPRRAHCASV